jgi:hypothetical protein
LHNGIAGKLLPLTKFYILWRWSFREAKIEFDEARKLAQSIGVHLEKEWNKSFIKKDKNYIKVLGPQERKLEDIENMEKKDLIDVLHLKRYTGHRETKINRIERYKPGND